MSTATLEKIYGKDDDNNNQDPDYVVTSDEDDQISHQHREQHPSIMFRAHPTRKAHQTAGHYKMLPERDPLPDQTRPDLEVDITLPFGLQLA